MYHGDRSRKEVLVAYGFRLPSALAAARSAEASSIAGTQQLGNLTMIYDANQNQIRDPDLIYPGQIFTVPQGN